ncbi:MAG TPA: chloride channel protein, partial [Balneolaceae bacterium]|nr:chloride channel protein [Balneolaceae bacterium]
MASKFNRSLIVDSVVLGVVGALSAQLFMFMLDYCDAFFMKLIADYQAPGLPNEGGMLTQTIGAHWLWFIPLVTTVGGLISGFIIYTWAPEAEGHGTDTAVRAFHKQDGNIRARVPFLKMIASAITIGSGGAAGREGPIALIASGFGSLYALWTGRSAKEKRILVLVGMAAGLSAIFRSPIGSAIFAVEVLYGGMEFEAGALIYTTLAAIVAYTVNGVFVGWQPLFQVPANLQIHDIYEYGLYILLGIGCGLMSTIVPPVFYGIRDAFHKISIPDHFKPAIGGLGVGLLALWLPQVLGGGYGWIQEAINGQLGLKIMIILVFA